MSSEMANCMRMRDIISVYKAKMLNRYGNGFTNMFYSFEILDVMSKDMFNHLWSNGNLKFLDHFLVGLVPISKHKDCLAQTSINWVPYTTGR